MDSSSEIIVDGEELVMVTLANLEEVCEKPFSHSHAKWWLESYGCHNALRLTVRRLGPLELLQPVVKIEGEWYRTHIEGTICGHCSHRVSAAAVGYYPDFSSELGPAKEAEIRQKAFARPVLSCPKCSQRYDRRGIIWFAEEDPASPDSKTLHER